MKNHDTAAATLGDSVDTKQTVTIGKQQAKKLGKLMEYLIESGVESITRDEAAEHCIDWVHEMVKKKGFKVRPK
jgi:hypothetical protein